MFSDVDSAYAIISSNLALLRPYRDRICSKPPSVRDTVSFAYQNGGASLLDFLSCSEAITET